MGKGTGIGKRIGSREMGQGEEKTKGMGWEFRKEEKRETGKEKGEGKMN